MRTYIKKELIILSIMSYSESNQNNENKQNQETADVSKFEMLDLKDNLLRGIYAYGFENPSPIQCKAIQPMVQGLDMIAQSQSGTGKTGTFTISALQIVDENVPKCQAIILAPTRDLALQIYSVASSLSSHMERLKLALCTGGMLMSESRQKLQAGAQIAIGTPGRIIKMIEIGALSTRLLRVLIMDEADDLLSMSFLPQIETVIGQVPAETQVCLFSATMPRHKIELTNRFIRNPYNILVRREELTLNAISQFSVAVGEEEWKLDTLCDLYETIAISQSMIYVNTKQRAIWLAEKLTEKGFTISVMHSGLTPVERTEVMNKFRKGGTRILVSTDLLARGIDIQQVSIVVNYDIPRDKECYLHRIGRSGRFGRRGVAINFVSNKEFRQLREIERFYGTKVVEMPENIQSFL